MNKETYNILLEIKESTTKEDLLTAIRNNEREFSKYRVWVLTGKEKSDAEEEYLLVAQTENIINELKDNINAMFNVGYSTKGKENIKLSKTEFGEFPYINGGTKGNYKIRYIKETFKELIFYGVDLDKYLELSDGINISDIQNEAVKKILDMSEDYYVEGQIAYEHKPKYWNFYRSGVGKRTLYMISKENNKKLKEVQNDKII